MTHADLRDGRSAAELAEWMRQHLDPLDDDPALDMGVLRPDINYNPEGWPLPDEPPVPAAVLVGLVDREDGVSVILTRRSDNLRSHTGQVALPGGRCDPGEASWQTALREAEEEIGLHPSFVSLVGLSTPFRTGTNYLMIPVVGVVKEGFTLKPNPHEVAEIFETPFAFLMDPASYEAREGKFKGAARTYYAATYEEKQIWGATAGVLRLLYDRLFGAALG